MRKILFLRGGALGDFIVTLPALALLRERWPHSEITLVGNARAAALAQARGLVQHVLSQDEARWAALYSERRLPDSLRAWLVSFDLVVNFWPDPDGQLQRHFPTDGTQIFVAGAAVPTLAPAARHYCVALQALGMQARDFRVQLSPQARVSSSSAAVSLTNSEDARVIAVHPGSGSPRKNWPAERWLEVIRTVDDPVLVILGEAESIPWEGLIPNLPRHTRLAVNRPLEDLVTAFANCRLFLGHDSGISHLAAACGAPSLLLFGPTDPAMWAPPGSAVRMLRRAAGLDALSVSEFQAELRQALAEHK